MDINHRKNLVYLITGAQTQSVKNMWPDAKQENMWHISIIDRQLSMWTLPKKHIETILFAVGT